MAFTETYRKQAALLVRVLPYIAEEESLALKGGTAINLFLRDMPRLSIDIDLTYVPIQPRPASLAAIEAALMRIAQRIRTGIPKSHVTESRPEKEGTLTKLVPSSAGAQITIEVNTGVVPLLFYLLCHHRPMHEVLTARRKDITTDFSRDFDGMTAEPVSIEDLKAARETLIANIVGSIRTPALLDLFRARDAGLEIVGTARRRQVACRHVAPAEPRHP